MHWDKCPIDFGNAFGVYSCWRFPMKAPEWITIFGKPSLLDSWGDSIVWRVPTLGYDWYLGADGHLAIGTKVTWPPPCENEASGPRTPQKTIPQFRELVNPEDSVAVDSCLVAGTIHTRPSCGCQGIAGINQLFHTAHIILSDCRGA